MVDASIEDRGMVRIDGGAGRNLLQIPEGPSGQSLDRPVEGYSRKQRQLHWIVAALVAVQLIIGAWMGTTAREPANAGMLHQLMLLHVLTGTVIFVVMVGRLRLRRRIGAPPSPAGTPLDASLLARLNHLGFYVLLLAMPPVGWVAYLTSGSLAALFRAVHGGLALTLVVAIGAHLCGVIYHSFVRNDGLLKRMM